MRRGYEPRRGALAGTLEALLAAAGRPDRALKILADVALPPAARVLALRLAATVAAIEALAPWLTLTVDPVEGRGFRYHTGICMTVFAPGRHEELGRGGRYLSGEGEPSSGLTLYADAVLRAAPGRPERPRVYVPADAPADAARALREEGLATVRGLFDVADASVEARRLGCSLVLRDGVARKIAEDGR